VRWHGPGAIIFAFFLTDPAAAQLAATAGFESDYRYRGYSLTDNHPALTAQLSYDDPSGFYGSVLGLQDLGHGARFLGAIADAGYAKRLSDKVTIDGGVLRSQIRSATPGGLDFKYTEFYAGAYVGPVAGRIYYSPDYRTSGQSALYGELEAGFEPAAKWRVSGHVGLLKYLNTTEYWKGGESHRDWRVTVGRRFGKFEVHSALSGGGPTYYGPHHNPRLSIGGSFTF
jgi:uncharacterized protein (TIGR02001 family)